MMNAQPTFVPNCIRPMHHIDRLVSISTIGARTLTFDLAEVGRSSTRGDEFALGVVAPRVLARLVA